MEPAAHPTDNKAGAGPSIVAILAGLAGAAGVTLAAVAAHGVPSQALATAANMLVMHAAATLAIAAIAGRASGHAQHWLFVAALMLLGVALFSGDIALNTLKGFHIFPMAAPIGGSLLIASWLAVALAAALDWRQSSSS